MMHGGIFQGGNDADNNGNCVGRGIVIHLLLLPHTNACTYTSQTLQDGDDTSHTLIEESVHTEDEQGEESGEYE